MRPVREWLPRLVALLTSDAPVSLSFVPSVRSMLRNQGWSEEGYVFAYLYALTVSAYAFTKCLSAPFVGHLSDLYGRRNTLTTTLLVTGICLLATGYCGSWTSLILCRLLTGLFANGGLLTAYAADVAFGSIADRTTLFSYFITAWAFARVAAAWIFSVVGEDEDVQPCCMAAFACEMLAALLTATCFRSTDHEHGELSQSSSPTSTDASSRREDVRSPQVLSDGGIRAQVPFPSSPNSGAGDSGELIRRRRISRNPFVILRDRPSFRAAFREMMRDRLVALLFLTSLLMPRIDIAAYLWKKFERGPSAVGFIKAFESVTVILVPLTPVISSLTGNFGHAGAAVFCSALIAICWLSFVFVRSMDELYVMVRMGPCSDFRRCGECCSPLLLQLITNLPTCVVVLLLVRYSFAVPSIQFTSLPSDR